MSIIGENIKKYRKQMNYTQEKLGMLIGVTTQAVSKWERGGTPDAEILPALADTLKVSIDALFGREEQNINLLLSKKLSAAAKEDAFIQAFDYCCSFVPGLTGDERLSEKFYDVFTDHSEKESTNSPDILAKIMRDEGISLIRMSNDFRYFFLLTRPKDGNILDHFESEEAVRQVFSVFSDKKMLKIIYYLYTVSNIPVTASLISQGTGLKLDEVERCMKTLCDKEIIHPMDIASVEGEIHSYIIRFEANILPLLCYADEIAKGCQFPIFGMCERQKPIF